MSDYLSNIAARSLNLAEVVKPRLASLYEPQSADGPQFFKSWKRRDHGAPAIAGSDDHRPGVINAEAAESPPRSMEIDRTQSNLRPQRETANGLGVAEDQRRSRLSIGHPSDEASADSFNTPRTAPASSASYRPKSSAGRSMDIHRSGKISTGPFEQDRLTMIPPVQSDASKKNSMDLSWRPEGRNEDAMQSQDEPENEKRSDPEPKLRAVEKKAALERPWPGAAGEESAILPRSVTRPLSVAQEDNRSNVMPSVREIRIDQAGEEEQRLPARPLHGPPSTRVRNNPVPGKIIVQPDVAAHVSRADAKIAEQVTENEPEPTIQVTIGRIEVRALSQPARSQKERWKPPVMDLDEYLSRQRGGI